MEQTFVMVKPDAVAKGLIGEIVKRFENKGLEIKELRLLTLSQEKAAELYAVHKERPFFNDLVEYVTGGPVVVMKLEGQSAVVTARNIIGATNPVEAASGTIRGDFGLDISQNLIHGSDSPENAQKELSIFFE
ncbi:hypothetical protein LCGC14_1436730 [marine sediment metagenome]|uniref:Nucleoside diphosphate kinase n=1 Tax=marine sediment metagenome TaxID=412755 RepID=A0A0F9JM12_9ZZZZ|nr:nucleoside-diphosphate kinase [Actinomycetota bacterium]